MTPSARPLPLALLVALLACAMPGAVRAQAIWTFPGDVALETPTSVDFRTGFSTEGSVTLLVRGKGNRPWRLQLRATAPDMGGAGKPSSDVYWRTSSSSAWTPLSSSYVPLATGRGNSTVTLYFRTRLQWAMDRPGTYNAPIEFGLFKG